MKPETTRQACNEHDLVQLLNWELAAYETLRRDEQLPLRVATAPASPRSSRSRARILPAATGATRA